MKELENLVHHGTDVSNFYEEPFHWRTEDNPQKTMDLYVKTISLRNGPPLWVYDDEKEFRHTAEGTPYNLISLTMDEESYIIYKEERYFHPIIAIQDSIYEMDRVWGMIYEIVLKVADNVVELLVGVPREFYE